eukprot:g29154.t1
MGWDRPERPNGLFPFATATSNRPAVNRCLSHSLSLPFSQIGHGNDLPKELPQELQSNEEFLQKVHHVLLEVEVVEGVLKCPESGREFPISKGIPNMLLNEDE